MTTIHDADSAGVGDHSSARTLPWWAFGLANVAVVAVLSVSSWWLLVDPAWGVLQVYPQPFTATLFWTIIAVVWLAFNFEWLGPVRLRQPARGLVAIVLTLALGVAITVLLAKGWGAIDPSFAASREGGAGYTTGNLMVLFAFFFYATVVVNWNHWPWARVTAQPYTGLGEMGMLAMPTVALFGVFVLPNLATWAVPGTAVMSVPTLIGWFYCIIVSVVVTGVITDNWPWRLAGSPVRVVAFSLVGNLVLGTVIYFVLLNVAELLMGPANATALGAGVSVHAAELGVCWVFWMLAWANAFGNPPSERGDAATFGIRIGATLALGVLSYLLYYFFLARVVLHEPRVVGSMHGDALGFFDWAVLWLLWYLLFLESYGLPRMRTGPGHTPPVDATETPLTHGHGPPHEHVHYH